VLGKFIESEEINPILSKYFVVTHLEMGKAKESNPGTDTYLAQYGGEAKGAPFLAFVDAQGKLVINSLANGTDNIGYPAEPAEIDWFMQMLHKAAPQMSKQERGTIESKLRSYKKK
jgi:hypothetical protein